MKKSTKRIIAIVIAAVLLAALFVPFRSATYRDGGTREYWALAYKVVKWHRFYTPAYEDEVRYYENTRTYWFPNNFKSIDELWKAEIESAGGFVIDD